MQLLDKLEEWFGRFAVRHVTLGIVVAQALVYLAYLRPNEVGELGDMAVIHGLELVPSKVLAGEVWRVVTFVAVSPLHTMWFLPTSLGGELLGMFFALYLFYLMGTSLETHWGTFRYNLFLLTGWAATVAASFLRPDEPASVTFLAGAVFLAFAHLNPTFQLYIFWVVPIEIRWLALLTWIGYASMFFLGDWAMKVNILAAIANYLLFFGTDIFWMVVSAHHRMTRAATGADEPTRPVPAKEERRCVICGLVSSLDPSMEFRFCSKCEGMMCYCSRHIRDHEHVVTAPQPSPSPSTGTKAAQ